MKIVPRTRLDAEEPARRRQRWPAFGLLPAVCLALAFGCLPGWAQTSATFAVENGAGNLHIADKGTRKVDATSAIVSTVAGTATRAPGGDGGSATDAMPDSPAGTSRTSLPSRPGGHRSPRSAMWRLSARSNASPLPWGLTGFEAPIAPGNGLDDISALSALPIHPNPKDNRSADLSPSAGDAAGAVAAGEHGVPNLGAARIAEADAAGPVAQPDCGHLPAASAAAPVPALGLEPSAGRAGARAGRARRACADGGPLGSRGNPLGAMDMQASALRDAGPGHFALAAGAVAQFDSADGQTPYPPLPLEPPHNPVLGQSYTNNTCPEFHKLDGEDLVQAILTADGQCITRHISYPPAQHLRLLFSEEKMITIIRKFKELSEIYQGNNQDKITRFLEYISMGFYYRIYNLTLLDPFFTERLKTELHQSLSVFAHNSHFRNDSNEEHLNILYRFVYLLYLSNEATPYIDQLIGLLDDFSLDHPEFMRNVIRAITYILQGSHVQHNLFDLANNFEFRDHVLNNDAKVLEALIRFSRRDDLLNSEETIDDTASVLYKAVENIGLFLQYGDYPDVYHLAHDRMEEILARYSVDSDEKFLRFLAANAIKHWSLYSSSDLKPSCSTNSYDICRDELDWREAIFPPEYSFVCQATDEVLFKFMRDVPLDLKRRSCADVIKMDHLFHQLLKTRKIPVADDHNHLLEVIVFSSRRHMAIYGTIYNVSPNIGGAYREGNASNPENVPRVFVHEVEQGPRRRYVNVLNHEFVHYLDGRYNRAYPRYSAGNSLWWIEGLATYIPSSKYNRSISSITRERYRLSEIFPTANRSSQRTYFYGSLAIEFLVEEHFEIARELIDIMRNGWQGWSEKLEEMAAELEDEFDVWLDDFIELLQDPSQGYCRSAARSPYKGYIASLTLAGRQIPTYLNTYYAFLNRSHPINVSSGGSYDLDIVIGTRFLDASNYRIEVWVDWNDDKAFSDDDRTVHAQITLMDLDDFQTLSHRIEVPENTQGTRRMRVRVSDSQWSVFDVCSNYGTGETEDYALEVLPAASYIAVRSVPEEVNGFLRVRNASRRQLRLRDIFHAGSGQNLTYTAASFDPQTVAVTLDGDWIVIRNRSSRSRTSPVKVVLTATNESGQMAEKEIYVLFEPYSLPLFLSTEDPRKESFVRVINRSNRDGVVSITATDESGEVRGPVSLSLEANQTSHFNSRDLEDGNAEKGIGALGRLGGQMRLTLESDLDFKALNYVRADDGFLTSMNEQADFTGHDRGYRYFVPIFNPASNRNQQSVLKLFNHGEDTAHVTIRAMDDRGQRQTASLDLAPGSSQAISSNELENGADSLTGSLGDGKGKWRFQIDSTQFIEVVNLMKSPTGHLSNLSSHPSPSTWRSKNGGSVVSQSLLLLIPDQENRQGFVRIINRSPYAGEVTIQVRDDSFEHHGQVRLSMDANSAKHFNASDLANGNANKGIPGGLGDPQGMWQLHLESELDVQALSYMRASDGFLTKLYGVLPMAGRNQYAVDFFNPASNRNQKSLLRFINDQDHDVSVQVTGTDDLGQSGATGMRLVLPARTTKTLSALDLENGRDGVSGSFGDGEGKWKLSIETSHPLLIMNLMESPNGYLSNLCTRCVTAGTGLGFEDGGDDHGDADGGGGVGDDHGDVRSSATEVALPSETDGRIEAGTDVDYFRFEVAEAREVTIGTTGALDTVGTLEDGEGGELASNDDGGTGGNFSIRRGLSAGTYHIRVESYGSSTGAYTLALTAEADEGVGVGDDHGDARSSATEVALPSETAGRIEPATDVDYFRFEVAETRTVTAGTPGNGNTWVTLEDGEGRQLERNTVQDGSNWRTARRSLSPGTYYVHVESYQSVTGPYTLRLTAEADDSG